MPAYRLIIKNQKSLRVASGIPAGYPDGNYDNDRMLKIKGGLKEKMSGVQLTDDIHMMIVKKRIEIFEKYGQRVDMKDVACAAILAGMGEVEKILGLIGNELVE